MTKIKGIDVSKWQTNINWKKVKAAGVKFVMIRVLYGLDTCSRFHEHIRGATDVGLDVGVYVYSLAKTPAQARAEALRVVQLVKPYNITYPIAYDLEDKSQMALGKTTLSKMIDAFCTEVLRAGYTPILYSNPNWLTYYLDYNTVKKYDLWLAHYVEKSNYKHPYTIWQYTDKGRVDGIAGNVDLNWSYKDYGKEYRKMISDLQKKIKDLETTNNKLNKDLKTYKSLINKYQSAGLKVESLVKNALKTRTLSSAHKAGNEILKIIKQFK